MLGVLRDTIIQLGSSCLSINCESKTLDLLGSYSTSYSNSLHVLECLV